MGSSRKVSALIETSQTLIRSGQIDTARSMLREMLREEPDDGRVWYAYSFVAEGLDKRIDALEKTLILRPDSQRASRRLRQLKAQLAAENGDPPDEFMPDTLTAHLDTDTFSSHFTPPRRKPSPALIMAGVILVCTFVLFVILSIGKLVDASTPNMLPTTAPLGMTSDARTTSLQNQ